MTAIIRLAINLAMKVLGTAFWPLASYFVMASTFPLMNKLGYVDSIAYKFIALTSILAVIFSRFRPTHAAWSISANLSVFAYHILIAKYPVASPTIATSLTIALATLTFILSTGGTLFPLNLVAMAFGFGRKSMTTWYKVKGVNHSASNVERGRQFEEYVANIFRSLYGNAETTAAMKERGALPNTPGDKGVDVIFYRTSALKPPSKVLAQCKYYSGKVDIKAVQEIVGAKAYYQGQDLMLVTNSTLTKDAMQLAVANGVQVIQGHDLKQLEAQVRQAV